MIQLAAVQGEVVFLPLSMLGQQESTQSQADRKYLQKYTCLENMKH